MMLGCAASAPSPELDTTLLPEIDVVQVKENSDEALRMAQEAKLDVEMANTKLTEMDNKLLLLSEEVASISIAKIEEIENKIALMIEALKDMQAQIEENRVMPRVRKARSKKGPPTFTVTSPEYATYQTALRTFNARNYEKAREMFVDVMKQYPRGKYIDNCQYWIGECYYAQGDYGSAIAAFQKVQEYPNSSKGDDALFKVGKAYLAMGQTGQAKLEWNKFLVKYPNSEYLQRAKKYIAELQ